MNTVTPLLGTLMLALMPVVSFAQEASEQQSQSMAAIGESVSQPSDYFGQIVISLVLVLLIIFVSAWLLRRYGRFPGVADGHLKVLGALSVGQRERILLLQVGKEQILVGVTSNKISCLHQLEEPVLVEDNVGIKTPFTERFQEALKTRSKSSREHQGNDSKL